MSNRFSRLTLFALFTLLVLAFSSAQTFAENTSLSPQVIDVWPLPGVELAPDATLMISFDQTMDQASVEAAISVQPSIAVAAHWQDERTLILSAKAGWPRNMSYSVAIGTTAKAQNGLGLAEEYGFDIQTMRSLRVASITPEDGAEGVAAENARLVVTFDRPVVPLVGVEDQRNLPTPISIAPSIPGSGEWVNTSIYVYTPSSTLHGSTLYTITVSSGLEASDGTTLAESVISTFRTLAPQTLTIKARSTWPASGYEAVLLDSAFEATFSQPMDRASTEAAFRLESYDDQFDYYDGDSLPKTQVAGTFVWNTSSTLLTFKPDDRLENYRGYIVTIDTSAQSGEGAATLVTPAQANFRTVDPPAVRETSPKNGEIMRPGRGLAVFRFNTRMNTASFEDHYTISPEPEGVVVPYVYEDESLALEFEQQVDVIYTVTLLPGIEDIYGNKTTLPFVLTYFVQNGDVRTSVQPHLNAELVEVGTYQDTPALPVGITGSPTITLDIYALDMKTLDAAYRWKSVDPTYYDYYYNTQFVSRLYQAVQRGKLDAIPWVQPENRLSTWTQSFKVADIGAEGKTISIPLAGADGKVLPAGLYGVEITAPGALGWDHMSKTGFVLVVADVALTVKSAPGEALVWVTDFVSAKPVTNAAVQVIRAGEVIVEGETDTSGIFHVPAAALDTNDTVFIESSGQHQYGVWNSSVFLLGKAANTYIYTDRPIYRPGETVYYRGVIRDQSDMTYSVPDVHQLRVVGGTGNYYTTYGQTAPDSPFYDMQVDVSSFGTFSGAFTLPSDLTLGSYTIFANSCLSEQDASGNYCSSAYGTSITFEVGEFRVPEYEVKVTPQQDEIIAGDPINALVSARYYFGGAVGKANVTWNVYENYYYDGAYYQDTNFQQPGAQGYTFADEDYSNGNSANSETPAQTDAAGDYLVDTSVQIAGSRPARMAVEATVTDESGQAISARGSVLVHPANVYVGLLSSETFGNVDGVFDINILTVTPQHEKRPDQTVELQIEELRWVRHTIEFGKYEWDSEVIPVETVQVITDQEGKGSYAFTAPNVGIFRVRAIAKDEKGRQATSAIRVYARETGQTRSGVWWDPYLYDYGVCGNSSEVQLLHLTPNSSSYRPGDTAEIFIPNPYDGPVTALITVERAGVMDYEVLTIEGEALTYDLPITDEDAPNVYVGVAMMRGISADNPDPTFVRGNLRLDVEPVNRRLNVSVSPSQQVVKPGDQLSFDILVTDSHGNPAQAEVGVALTDEAALALRPPNSGTLEAKFYSRQPLRVMTSTSARALLSTPDNSSSGGCGGGGGGAQIGIIRDDFIYTPLWSPHTVTDADGHATVSVKMPDNLTRWRLDARAVSMDTEVGQAQINVVSTLPLIVRPVTPRFFVAGDHMPLAAIVNNNTEKEQVVDVTLQATGVQVEGAALTQTVTVEPNGRVRVEWPVVVQDVDGVDMTVFAASADYQDAAKPALRTGPNDTIPIYRYVAPETVRTGGILTSATAATEAISLPSRFSDVDGTLTVQLDPSLAAAAVEGLDYLRNYPHQCIEQTVSRFLPNVIVYRALSELGLKDDALKTGLDESLAIALKKLAAEQNSDGGWGWFGNMESSPLTTAYALLGLVETQVSGYDVDNEVIAKAADYLQKQLIDIKLNTPSWELNQQAFMLYVLGRWQETQSNADSSDLMNAAASLYSSRLELSYAGQAYLLMVYTELAPNDEAGAALVSDLSSAAILSATGAHWEEAETDWWNWGSDTRTTALALTALVQRDSTNPLLPNIVRWLMVARRGDHWQSTQETTWALIGLTDWMKSTGELRGDYDYTVALNNLSMGAGRVTPDTIQETRILQTQVSSLLHDSSNQLVIERGEGEGALYYATDLNLELPADEVQPVSRGITINREYFLNENSNRVISNARIGDIITVRLSLTLPQDIYYFVLEDVLPAGTEVIDTNLLTATDTVDGPTLKRDDPRWYWGYWYFDKVELRDKGAVLYADFLPRGAYIFTYQIRATSSGEFQVIPAQAYAFYQPDVFGRTAGTKFAIENRQ